MTYENWKKAERVIKQIDDVKQDIKKLEDFKISFVEDEGNVSFLLYPYDDAETTCIFSEVPLEMVDMLIKEKNGLLALLEAELGGL